MMTDVRLSQGFPLAVAVRSDVGRVRSNNEDSFGSHWLPDGTLLVIVADGMGGHEAGEVASGMAVDVIRESMVRDLEMPAQERIYRSLVEANQAIIDAGSTGTTRGMGTTAVVALIRGKECHIGLVGDSRLFHIRAGHMLWRTLDHTRVQSLLDRGIIREDEARDHPDAGMLTRALGHAKMSNGKPLVPEVLKEPLLLNEGDALVLSSDGLHDLVDDWEIAMAVNGEAPVPSAESLVSMALERGGHDNVTVAVVVAGGRATTYDPAFASSLSSDLGELPPIADDTDHTNFGDHPGDVSSPPAPRPPPQPASTPANPLVQEPEALAAGTWDSDERWLFAVAVLGVLLLSAAVMMLIVAGIYAMLGPDAAL